MVSQGSESSAWWGRRRVLDQTIWEGHRPGPEVAALVRPPNVRFGGGASLASAGAATTNWSSDDETPQPVAAADPDETLRNWIYVDFTGKPLSGVELAAAADSQMVHLMPFVMRLVIDQRQIDALLASLSTAAIPIDVRQVRINASNTPATDLSFGQFTAVEAAGGQTGSGRMYDVNLELRGTVGLATPPSAKAVGVESGGGGDQPVAAPSAALASSRPAEDRIMKMPKVSFNKAALLAFLMLHGEKLVAAVLGLVACSLVWGGIGAIRSLRPSAKQEPQAIVADAAAATEHIDKVKIHPLNRRLAGRNWRKPSASGGRQA